MNRMQALALVAGKVAFGATMVAGLHTLPVAMASPMACVDDGNHICAPGNAEGKPAACYDQGGVIVAMWPCHVVIDPRTGDSDVYEGLADTGTEYTLIAVY